MQALRPVDMEMRSSSVSSVVEPQWLAMGNFVHTAFNAYCGVLLGLV